MTSPIVLLEPIWLLLAVPLAAAAWRWPPAGRLCRALRWASYVLLLLALARPALQLPSRAGTLVVVADRSASMPVQALAAQREVIDLLQASMPAGNQLGVVAFGAEAAVEQLPQAGRFSGFVAAVGAGGSQLAAGLERALALLPPEANGRLLVLSDGRWTGRDPAAAAGLAALRGTAVDFRLLERPAAGDLAIERVEAPSEVSPGEGFLITAWVRAPSAREVAFELRRGAQVLAAGRRQLPAGRSRLSWRDRADLPGTASYQLQVRAVDEAASADPVEENNLARLLVTARGPRPVLVLSSGGAGELPQLLAAGGLEVVARRPREVEWSLATLGQYAAVVLEDLPAGELGTPAMTTLAAWVEHAGGGLMMTGGPSSYGPGGYFRSPLEALLPVSMELRQEHRKLALAVVVALDRSGSMAAAVPGGRTKMDLANLATVEVLDLLSPLDEFGVIAVDSSAHVIGPLDQVSELRRVRGEILRIESMGGGIFVYEALAAAVQELNTARAGTRHVVLFADAADAEEPGAYRQLLARCRDAGITVSVIGLGTEQDVDAELLRDIARRGGGQVFFTEDAHDLPRLFAQDTFMVARSSFLEQETAVRVTPALASLSGRGTPPRPPAVGGYNLTYLRAGAELAAVTADDYQAPLIAAWPVGLGRALALTAQVDGPFTGPLASWPEVGDFLTGLVRWTAGATGDLPMLVRQRLEPGLARIELHLDPERTADPFVQLPRVTVLRGEPGRPPQAITTTPSWVSPDQLELAVPLSGDEVVLATLDVPGVGRQVLPPMRLPYAPELRPAEPGAGLAALDRLARATGGRQRLELERIWQDFPRQPRRWEVGPWPLLVVLVLLLSEVFERRTGLLAAGLQRTGLPARGRLPRWRGTGKAVPVAPEPAPASTATPAPVAEPVPAGDAGAPAPDGVVDALGEARRRMRRRQGEPGPPPPRAG